MKNQTNRSKNNGTHTHTYTHTHTHIYTQTKPKHSKTIKYKRVTWWKKETKNGINQLKTKLTKTQPGNKTKAES